MVDFEDLSDAVIQDDLFQPLLTFPNVLITGHQAFFTEHPLQNLTQNTLSKYYRYGTRAYAVPIKLILSRNALPNRSRNIMLNTLLF